MIRMIHRPALVLCVLATALPASSETVTIYRDEFGVPHIYAETAEAGIYGQGYAMAEDGLAWTLQNFLRALGRFSGAFGPGENEVNIRADLESLMWDHYGKAKKYYRRLPEAFRSHNAAFVAGINAYMKEHADQVPDWWTIGQVDVYMPIAFSRQFIWRWPAGQAASDLQKIGLSPNYDVTFAYSNEMAIAPERTAFGSAVLISGPHLSWYGRFRHWEVRIHAGDIHISGFATAGLPYVNLGHNEHVAWAFTTGGPDTADVYELTMNPENPHQYLYDGEYRDLTTHEISLEVKGENGPRSAAFYYSNDHGPIVAREGDKAYAAALSYAEEIGYLHAKYKFMIAKDYRDIAGALEIMQIMPQNVMVADTRGNIYYQRTGRTPIRPEGFDFSRPVDGSTSQSKWGGIHPMKNLIQVLNPSQGYMQNCNITPDVMMVGSRMTASKYPSYIFNQPERRTHQRATRATEILHTNDTFTLEQVFDLAVDQKCYHFERWVAALRAADGDVEGERGSTYMRGLRGLAQWDGDSHKDSPNALKYYYWRRALRGIAGADAMRALASKIENYLELFGDEREPEALTEEEKALLVRAFSQGVEDLLKAHGDLDATFGRVFHAGRLDYNGTASYPVGGGQLCGEGMATIRSIGFAPEREDGTRWGTSGQTSTEVVIMSDPIQSFTQPRLAQSDHRDSPHFGDQAEKLRNEGRLKPSWFHKDELLDGHVESVQELQYAPN